MRRYAQILQFVMILLLTGLASASADDPAFQGEIRRVSPATHRIMVDARVGGQVKSFSIPAQAQIVIDGRIAPFSDLRNGQSVDVYTDGSDQVTRLLVLPASDLLGMERKGELPQIIPSSHARDAAPATAKAPAQWTQFRGSGRANRSADVGLAASWPRGGPPLLWTARGLGDGYSNVSLSPDFLLTMGSRGSSEMVIALDRRSGTEVWSQRIGSTFRDHQGNGPRSTPTIDDSRVYAMTGRGVLTCLNLGDGTLLWSRNLPREFTAAPPDWGVSESPLVDGDRLICTPGGSSATMVALNKHSGATEWEAIVPGRPRAAYSSAIVATLNGTRQYVNYCHDGLFSVGTEDGAFLWKSSGSANDIANCATPLAWDGHIFSASGYGTGGALLEFSSSGRRIVPRTVYHTRSMKSHVGGMVYVDGAIYGADDTVLTCLDAATGEVRWHERCVGKGTLTYADGKLIVRGEDGEVALVAATPREYRELGRFRQPERSRQPTWPAPVVVGGRLYLRDQGKLFCFDLRPR